MRPIGSTRAQKAGFSIVEVMISTTLFTIVVVIGIGALLSASRLNTKTDNARQAIDSMSFAMEDMARNLRLGQRYRCASSISVPTPDTASDCASGGSVISFEGVQGAGVIPPDPDDQIVYFIARLQGMQNYALWKSTESGANPVALTPPEVAIDNLKSGFSVRGSSAGAQHPKVVIRLSGTIASQDITYPFSLETSVSQRVIEQ